MSDLELAVRTIEKILPDMPTNQLTKWKGVFTSALVKLEDELNSTMMHKCGVCGSEEYGHRSELPIGWREVGDLVLCFNHEDNEAATQLKDALDADKEKADQTAEESLEELMDLL